MADKETIINLQPSNLETIDDAMFKWVNEHINVSATSNRGWEKVPVIWTSAERAFQYLRETRV